VSERGREGLRKRKKIIAGHNKREKIRRKRGKRMVVKKTKRKVGDATRECGEWMVEVFAEVEDFEGVWEGWKRMVEK
jgi:hypothetical protein